MLCLTMRIARVHALEESVAPIRDAFATHWPEADAFDLLDTALAPDRAARGLDTEVSARIGLLADYAVTLARADAVLFTCSAFGPAIQAAAVRTKVPVLTPNESAFRAAIEGGSRLGVIVTFEPSLAPLLDELRNYAGPAADITGVHVPEALAAPRPGVA